MDLNRVIGEVAARHGVRLDPDDPALVLVMLTELMLQHAHEEFVATTSRATVEFVEAAGRAQQQTGVALNLAESARRVGGALRNELARIPNTQGDSQDSPVSLPLAVSKPMLHRWVVLAVVTGVLLVFMEYS